MMRLWIDGQCLQTTSRLRGIGRYVSELIRAIHEFCPDVEMSISFNAAMTDAAIAARQDVRAWIEPRNIHVWQGVAQGGECGEGYTGEYHLGETALAHHMACLQPDIALSASPFEGQYGASTPLLSGAGHDIPRAAIFYDVIPHRYPSRYLKKKKDLRCYDRRIAAHRSFDLLLAISDFALREAEAVVPGVTVRAIDAGVSPDFIALSKKPADPAALAAMGVRKPYLFYVGGIDWRKNLAGVRQAWPLLPQPLRETLQFVMAGDFPVEWFPKFRTAWRQAALPDANLINLGHVSDEKLVQLYKQADLVIQPSLMEGFGLTALEAMSCGAPVIASDAGALPEVVGDARALFDPQNPMMIAERITQFLSDPELSRSLVAGGLRRAEHFSWQRTARLAVDALQAASRKPQPKNLENLRRITLTHLGTAPDRTLTAQILAAAEPRPVLDRKRLLIEVSYTARTDHGTGIQRVVKNIARAAMARDASEHRPETQLCYCDSAEGFFPATIDGSGKFSLAQKVSGEKIFFGPGDHIVMLDSSWTLTVFLIPLLRRARLQGSEVISVLYDLTPLKLPAFSDAGMTMAFAEWLKSALLYSTGFVCISRAVADELLTFLESMRYPRPLKIGYWRLGADLSGNASAAPRAEAAAPMFLMVSTLEPRKGYRVALDAFTILWRKGFAGTLCIIGKRGWGVDQLAADLKNHPEWGRKLTWLENADDEVLKTHYAACTALIVAAYAEGFGLPIVEAQIHGKPVIASDIPVFREVAGDNEAVTYFEMGSPDALAAAVENFTARHDRMPQVRQGKPVTWAQSAAELQSIVLEANWYRTYQPKHRASDVALDDVGDWQAGTLDTTAERRHRLDLVEGPIPVQQGAALKFVVRVTNLSEAVWSSQGAHGVVLGLRFGKGPAAGAVSKIPLLQSPGDAHYMALEIETRLVGDADCAEIALLQGKDDWWDGGLTVRLT